jgi:hypothetical protein
MARESAISRLHSKEQVDDTYTVLFFAQSATYEAISVSFNFEIDMMVVLVLEGTWKGVVSVKGSGLG